MSEHMTPIDRALLENFPAALETVRGCSESDRRYMGEVLAAITSGQELDLSRFGGSDSGQIAAFDTDEELDDYTYRVAGCVGEFWTRICGANLFPGEEAPHPLLLEKGVRFGKGLQLVNILRDLPKDLRQGRCYIPLTSLAERGLSPRALLNSAAMERFLPLYDRYLRRAEGYLADGRAYIDSLPRSQVRVRLACTLPMLIGVRTLALLRAGNVLDDRHTIRVSRAEVWRLILISLLRCLRPA